MFKASSRGCDGSLFSGNIHFTANSRLDYHVSRA